MNSVPSTPPGGAAFSARDVDPAAAALRLSWQGPLLGPSGYAVAGRTILKGLLEAGVEPRCLPTWDHRLSVHMTRDTPDLLDVEMEIGRAHV